MLRFVHAGRNGAQPAIWYVVPNPAPLSYPGLCKALDEHPKPILVAALAEPGLVGVWSFASEDSPQKQFLRSNLRSQLAYLKHKVAALAPDNPEVTVLLEIEGESEVYSLAQLEAWARDFGVVACGWTMTNNEDDSRAPLRLILRRPDGTFSPGLEHLVPLDAH
jgi:hypothetical protein